MPTTGADNGLTLEDMRDADYDDPRWEKNFWISFLLMKWQI